jgi:polynucleotide 5'-hydroxyl-kinase GRC3/NOL9
MVENWADVVADRIVSTSPLRKGKLGSGVPNAKSRVRGTLLLLGAADTGKTTLMEALVKRLARRRPVALVDADVGQSHIGPPTTVGWTVVRGSVDAPMRKSADACTGDARIAPTLPRFPASTYDARGIAFVGDVTPVGHLLQLAAALALCVEQARQAAEVILIDTPGLVAGGAACSLWWTVQRWLRPERIIAIQREDELGELLQGLQADLSAVERVEAPAGLRRKSPEARQEHRRRLFEEYFRDAAAHTLSLKGLAVRSTQRMTPDSVLGRIVSLTDAAGQDLAIGVIERWQPRRAQMTIRAPRLDMQRVRCVTLGDVRIEAPFGWSG